MLYQLLLIGLITDCHDSVKFLNRLPMGVLEESLEIFRANIFSMADRKQIPTLIYKVLEKELQEQNVQEMVSKYDSSLLKVA